MINISLTLHNVSIVDFQHSDIFFILKGVLFVGTVSAFPRITVNVNLFKHNTPLLVMRILLQERHAFGLLIFCDMEFNSPFTQGKLLFSFMTANSLYELK